MIAHEFFFTNCNIFHKFEMRKNFIIPKLLEALKTVLYLNSLFGYVNVITTVEHRDIFKQLQRRKIQKTHSNSYD